MKVNQQKFSEFFANWLVKMNGNLDGTEDIFEKASKVLKDEYNENGIRVLVYKMEEALDCGLADFMCHYCPLKNTNYDCNHIECPDAIVAYLTDQPLSYYDVKIKLLFTPVTIKVLAANEHLAYWRAHEYMRRYLDGKCGLGDYLESIGSIKE